MARADKRELIDRIFFRGRESGRGCRWSRGRPLDGLPPSGSFLRPGSGTKSADSSGSECPVRTDLDINPASCYAGHPLSGRAPGLLVRHGSIRGYGRLSGGARMGAVARYPIVLHQTFIEATRETGYRSTAAAVAELVDNAIQAGARIFRIFMREAGGGGRLELSVLDDGTGMDAKTLHGHSSSAAACGLATGAASAGSAWGCPTRQFLRPGASRSSLGAPPTLSRLQFGRR